MPLRLKQFTLFLVLAFSSAFLSAQTLYWVGGSGNFNDPKHWSLSSGGPSSNKVPNAYTEVIFDDNSSAGLFKVKLPIVTTVKSIYNKQNYQTIKLDAVKGSSLNINGSLEWHGSNNFLENGKVYFQNNGQEKYTIEVQNLVVNSNLYFLKGKFSVGQIKLAESKYLSFNGGEYNFKYSSIQTDNLIIQGKNSRFNIDSSTFVAKKQLTVSNGPKFKSNGFGLFAPFNDSSRVSIDSPVDFGITSKLSSNLINAVGDASIYAISSCSGSCAAIYSVVIDPANTGTYNVSITNFNCAATAASLSTTGLLPGASFTVGNVCYCPTNNFSPFIFDPVTFQILNVVVVVGSTGFGSFNFLPPSIGITPFGSVQPSCNLSCDGSMTLSASGGAPPYTVTISGPTPSVVITPNFIFLNSLCKGLYTLTAVDANGCTLGTPLVRNLIAPSLLTTNAITNSITCIPLCNGSFSIAPNGSGTPNYTIAFSNGSTLTTGPAGTVGINGLCTGVISATLTDSKGCTASTSTTIVQPAAAISFTPSQTNVSCNGGANGSATVLVAGGTPTYAYVWSPSASSSSVAGSLSAGPQTMTITDQNACTQTVGFNILQPTSLTLTPSSVNVVCTGSATGAATVSASGGTGPYNFTWTPASGSNTVFTNIVSNTSVGNLVAQNYSVSVLDANGCSSLVVIAITQPSPGLSLVLTSQSITCFGANNGSATATPSGGNGAPFTFAWTAGGPPTNASSVTNLPPGTHTVTVNDASLCPISGTVLIVEPATFTAAVTTSSLTCNSGNAACNGSAQTSPIGGVAPFTYTLVSSTTTLTAGPSTAAASFTGICSNAYTINALDASNCPFVATFSLTQPDLLTPSMAVPTMSCSNSTVTAVASAIGGTSGYNFVWTAPLSGTVAGANVSISSGGIYTLTVTDSQSCTAQTTSNVIAPATLSITIGTNSISCFNGSNGVLTSTVGGGTLGYNYLWSNSTGTVSDLPTANSLSPGNYTLLITDANSCTSTATGTVLSPSQITTTVNTTPVACFGQSNGSATVVAAGGTPGIPSYTFSVNFPTPVTNTSGVFTGQPAGVYTASVIDGAGCTQTVGVTITAPAALTATITGNVGSCSANNGSATVTASGGNGAYTYSWTPAGGTSSTATNLAPGNYSVTVLDASLCPVTVTTNIAFIVNISLAITSNTIACNGAQTGSANVTHTGGVAPFIYTWSAATGPTLTTQAVTTLSADIIYTVTVRDFNLCSNSATFQLSQPPAISINTAVTHVSCFGFFNGAISTTLSGGTAPLNPTWTPGGSNSTSLTLLSAGTYTMNVRDFYQCTASVAVTVNQPTVIAISFTNTNPTGCLANNGSVCASASGGSGAGYNYSLTPPGSANAGGCFTNLGGGAFTMLVTDGNGCSSSSITTLTNPSAPVLSVAVNSVACFGANTGIITSTATGAGPFTFSISPTTGILSANSPTVSVSSLTTGLYFLTAVDVNSCVTTQTVNVAQASSVTINSSFNNLNCNGIPTGSISVAPTQGTATPTFTYSWLPVAPPITGQGTGTIINLPANGYTLNLTDGNSCLTQYTFNLSQPPALTLTSVTSSLLCNAVCNGSIVVNVTGGTGAVTYSWNPPIAANTATAINLCANGTGTIPPAYTVTATDVNTCSISGSFTITQPVALTGTVNQLVPSCSNSCNAVASHTVNGGTPTYSFSWSSSPATTSSLGSLCPGNYTATVTDGNGCVLANQFTVTAPAPLSATLNAASPLCNAACNGSISTLVSGAQGTVSYVWSPAGTGQNPTGLCAIPNPVYTLVATDQNACQVTLTASLTNPPAVLASVSATNPVCHNNTNGSATVNFTNTTGATTYSWLSSIGTITQTAQTINSLSPASYTVIVNDANNCSAQTTFTLINPSQYTVSTLVTNSTCSLSTGAITVNVSGATPGTPTPYTYTWIAGTTGNSSVVTNVSSGAYSVQITDAAGCTTVVSAAVSDNGGPTNAPITSNSINCHGQCTGSATLDIANITGGTGPYTFSWLAPITATQNVVTGLCVGTYSAEIVDFNNCKFYPGLTITEPSSVTIASTSLAPLCNGICDGSIAITPTGGIAPYTYTWISSLGGGLPNSPSQTSLCAGDFTLLVGSNGVCVDTAFFSFPNQNTITIAPTVTNNNCFGDVNGVVSILVGGGNTPYTASWSNSQTGFTANNLSNGSYTVIVADVNGCQDTLVSTITSAPQLSLSTAVTSPSCGFSNGAAVATATGGTAPFTYSWSTGSNAASISGLAAGIYVVAANDNLLCNTSQTVIINNSNGITGETITAQQIPCAGTCDGAATITPIGGNPPITINWLSPAASGSVINNLCPGTYFVQMTDVQNCVRSASVTINPLITLSVSPFITSPSCGINNGSVNVVVSGGSIPYTFTWTAPSLTTVNTPTIGNVGAGSYTLVVAESSTNTCKTSQVINISNPGGPTISSTVTPNTCFGFSLASIQTIGTGTGTIGYNWNNGATTPALINLPSSTLTVLTLTVSSSSGTVVCNTLQTFTLSDPPQLLLNNELVHHPTCFGLIPCDGSISAQAFGGVAPYTYSWNNAATGNTVAALCDGTYSFVVTDANLCTLNSSSITLTSLSSISVTALTFSSSCSSVANGSINITPTGGVPTYSVSWQGPNGFTSTTNNLADILAGEYIYEVTDNLGCKKSDTLTIAPTITVVAVAGRDTILCPNTGTIALTGINSEGAESYRWYLLPNNTTTLSSVAEYTVENLIESGLYMLVATSSVASCFDSDTVLVDLFTLPLVSAGPSTAIPVFTTFTIGGSPTGATAVTFTWTPSLYLNNANDPNPIASNTLDITYTVTVTDANGCLASDTMQLLVLPEIQFTNAFSPNVDGKNDTWIIDYIEQFPESVIEIYNRWGELLFTRSGQQYVTEPFDGKYKGKDLPVGTYYYIINLVHPVKEYTRQFTGPLTIFR